MDLRDVTGLPRAGAWAPGTSLLAALLQMSIQPPPPPNWGAQAFWEDSQRGRMAGAKTRMISAHTCKTRFAVAGDATYSKRQKGQLDTYGIIA